MQSPRSMKTLKLKHELNEIDTTDKSIDDVLSVILDVINDNAHYPAGSIDFMGWFLS